MPQYIFKIVLDEGKMRMITKYRIDAAAVMIQALEDKLHEEAVLYETMHYTQRTLINDIIQGGQT